MMMQKFRRGLQIIGFAKKSEHSFNRKRLGERWTQRDASEPLIEDLWVMVAAAHAGQPLDDTERARLMLSANRLVAAWKEVAP